MLLAAALVWMGAAAGQTPAPADFYTEFAKHRDAIASMRAEFVQTTTNPDETDTAEGKLIYTRPKRLLFRYTDPPLDYMIDGLRAYEYDPDIAQVTIYDIEDKPESEAFYLGFESNADRLREAYEIYTLPPDDPATHVLAVEFVPKPKPDGESPLFERVRLQLRKSDMLPSKILIINDAESRTEFTVSNFGINEPMPEGMDHLKVPEGTVIVENDEYTGDVPVGGAVFPKPEIAKVDSEDLP
jgi:outer membrane lipoprotein carrier protein